MGTSNFYTRNASKTFAVGMNTEEELLKCTDCDEKIFEYEENFDELKVSKKCPSCEVENSLKEDTEYRPIEQDMWDEEVNYFIEKLNESKHFTEGGKDDHDRNFSGRSLGYMRLEKSFGDVTVEVRVQAMVRSGYYEGADLDYQDTEVFIDGSETEVDSVASDFIDYSSTNMNAGMTKIQSRNASKWAEKAEQTLTDELEEIYTNISMPLVVIAKFSNGETFYGKADDKRSMLKSIVNS